MPSVAVLEELAPGRTLVQIVGGTHDGEMVVVMGAAGRQGVRSLAWYLDGDDPPPMPAAPRRRHRPRPPAGRRRGERRPRPAPSSSHCSHRNSSRSGGVTVASGCRHPPAGCASAGSISCTSDREPPDGSCCCVSSPWSRNANPCPRPMCGQTCSSCCTTTPGASLPRPTGGSSTVAAGDGRLPPFRCPQTRAVARLIVRRPSPPGVGRRTLSSGSSATGTSRRDPAGSGRAGSRPATEGRYPAP